MAGLLLVTLVMCYQLADGAVKHQVSLKWKASASQGVKYGIGRGTKSGGPYQQLAVNISGLTYQDTTVVTKKSYYYVVVAYYPSCGTKCQSKPSNQVKATIP